MYFPLEHIVTHIKFYPASVRPLKKMQKDALLAFLSNYTQDIIDQHWFYIFYAHTVL